jgi:hypothetical protein
VTKVAYRDLVGKPEGKIRKISRSWKDNIKINLKNIGLAGRGLG